MLPPSVKCVLGGVLNGGGSTSTLCEHDFPNHNANQVWTVDTYQYLALAFSKCRNFLGSKIGTISVNRRQLFSPRHAMLLLSELSFLLAFQNRYILRQQETTF